MVIITHFLTMGWLMAFRWSRFNANSHGWAAISLDALVLRETLLAFFNSFLWCTIGIYSGILFIHQNLYDFKYLCNIWIIFSLAFPVWYIPTLATTLVLTGAIREAHQAFTTRTSAFSISRISLYSAWFWKRSNSTNLSTEKHIS